MPSFTIPLFKRCTKCGEEFPNTEEYFYWRGNRLRADCKKCRQAMDRSRYERKREIIIARVKEYIKLHPEKHKEWGKISAKRHPENGRRAWRKYDIIHRNERNKRNRDRYATNIKDRQRQAAKSRNRRALKSKAPGYHNWHDIEAKYKQQEGLCYWCSVPVFNEYHADHIIPLVKGGSNWPHNMVVSCPHCNVEKKDRIPYVEWIPSNPLYPF